MSRIVSGDLRSELDGSRQQTAEVYEALKEVTAERDLWQSRAEKAWADFAACTESLNARAEQAESERDRLLALIREYADASTSYEANTKARRVIDVAASVRRTLEARDALLAEGRR